MKTYPLTKNEVCRSRHSDFRPKQETKARFLLLWPWPWPEDLGIWMWP